MISAFSTVGNYDYGFFWYLHTDGTIGYEVKSPAWCTGWRGAAPHHPAAPPR